MDFSPLTSFIDNIKQKTTNPFLGTLITVWSISNWELIYTVFNFEEQSTLDQRISRIKLYLDSKHLFADLFLCIVEVFVILIVTYLLLNASRYILNMYENRVTPWIYSKSKPNSIVTLDIHNLVKEERDEWANRYDKERTEKLRIQADFEILNKKHYDAEVVQQQENRNLHGENQEFKTRTEELQKQIESYKQDIAYLNDLIDNKESTISELRTIIDENERNKLTNKNSKNLSQINPEELFRLSAFIDSKYSKEFLELLSSVNKKTHFEGDQNLVNFLISNEIIRRDKNDSTLFAFTQLGEAVKLEILNRVIKDALNN